MKQNLSTLITLAATTVALAVLVVYVLQTGNKDSVMLLLTALPIIIAQVANLVKTDKVDRQTNGTNQILRAQLQAKEVENARLRSIAPAGKAATVPVHVVQREDVTND